MKEQTTSKTLFCLRSMKTFRNIALGILIFTTIIIVGTLSFYNYQLRPVSNSKEIVKVEIPNNSTAKDIAKILKKNKLIRDERVFRIYVKIMKPDTLKAGHYEFKKNLGVKKIVKELEKGSNINPDEIKLTFKEGITMRDIAKVIEANTNNSYDSVLEKVNDEKYLDTVIKKYWFVSEEIKNPSIYYKLEGYLFPETYIFKNKDVTVEEIFNKMLDEMDKRLTPYKEDLSKNGLSIHQTLTLASMIEEEATGDLEQRKNIASVFVNRINRGMSLGSDVTTRYALKIDNPKQALSAKQYQTVSLYNTRLTDGSMNGKLPIGPIATFGKESLEASIYPNITNYIYFIANIKTNETFFFDNASGFEQKKNELRSVNGGL